MTREGARGLLGRNSDFLTGIEKQTMQRAFVQRRLKEKVFLDEGAKEGSTALSASTTGGPARIRCGRWSMM